MTENDKSNKLESFLFKSISYNMILQLTFRVFSFILNAILYRNVHTDLIGACNFRLALLYTTIMFLSREPFRRALPNFKSIQSNFSQFINSLWLVVPSGLLISIFFGLLWNLFEKPSDLTVKNYDLAILLCCISCLIELCGEPAYSIAQMLYLAKLKVVIEASCLFIFNLIFILLALYLPSLGALSYSIARFINAILFVGSNFYFLLKNKPKEYNFINLKTLIPNFVQHLDWTYLNLVKAYYAQSVFKQVLTEGERYLITFFNLLTYTESGIYDIVNNLGSLFARFIFLPIEDASYIYFTNSLKRGVKFRDQSENRKSKSYFEFLVKILSLIGLIVLVYGQSYSKLLLQLYGGSRLGENDICINLLRFHCVYIYFLALNGITEGFFNSTMSEDQLKKHNYRLVLFSLLFLAFAAISVNLFHIYGFLIANCLNMFIRILYSSLYIRNFFHGFKFKIELFLDDSHKYDIIKCYLPGLKLNLILVISFLITKTSELYLGVNHPIVHFSIGASMFLITCLSIFKLESQIKEFVIETFHKFKRA